MPKFWKPELSECTANKGNSSYRSPQVDRLDNNSKGKVQRPHSDSKQSKNYSRHESEINKPNRQSLDGVNKVGSGSINIDRDGDENSHKSVTTTLSKSVMSMKFMKRKVEDAQLQDEIATKKKSVTDIIWSQSTLENTTSSSGKLVCEVDLEDRLATFPGRRSFGGFNKAVERQYQSYLDSLKFEKLTTKSSKYNVDDEEMLQRYESLIGLPRGPNQGKRENHDSQNNNVKKFRKSTG